MHNTNSYNRKRIQPSLQQALTGSFNWNSSNMGFKFWEDLRNDITNGKITFGSEKYQIF